MPPVLDSIQGFFHSLASQGQPCEGQTNDLLASRTPGRAASKANPVAFVCLVVQTVDVNKDSSLPALGRAIFTLVFIGQLAGTILFASVVTVTGHLRPAMIGPFVSSRSPKKIVSTRTQCLSHRVRLHPQAQRTIPSTIW